jgi:hypothetical protein
MIPAGAPASSNSNLIPSASMARPIAAILATGLELVNRIQREARPLGEVSLRPPLPVTCRSALLGRHCRENFPKSGNTLLTVPLSLGLRAFRVYRCSAAFPSARPRIPPGLSLRPASKCFPVSGFDPLL